MLKNFLETASLAISLGGEVSFEWPKSCRGWLLEELIAFITRHELYTADVDGCALGMADPHGDPILRRWRFITTSARIAEALSKFKCQHPKDFRHGKIEGGDFVKSTQN